MYLLQLSRHTSKNGQPWLLVIFLMQLYLHLTLDLSRSKVHNLSRLAKRLGGWVRAYSLVGMNSYRNPEEEAKTL
jgi:hypothetical protein